MRHGGAGVCVGVGGTRCVHSGTTAMPLMDNRSQASIQVPQVHTRDTAGRRCVGIARGLQGVTENTQDGKTMHDLKKRLHQNQYLSFYFPRMLWELSREDLPASIHDKHLLK